MKKLFTFISLLLITSLSYAQKIVTIEISSRVVPAGKKWVIPVNKTLLIAVNPGALESGNLCNAQLRTANPTVGGIAEGPNPYAPQRVYSIKFTDLKRSGLDQRNVLSITTASFSKLEYGSYESKSVSGGLTFLAGQQVGARGCLTSIQAFEYNLTPAEMAEAKKRSDAVVAAQKTKEAVEEEAPKEETVKEKFAAGKPLEFSELANKPQFITTDTNNIHSDITSAFQPLEKYALDYYTNGSISYFFVNVDAEGNISSVIIDKRQIPLDNEKIAGVLKQHFRVNEAGLVQINGKKVKTPFRINVILDIKKKDYDVSQYLKITRNDNNSLDFSFSPNPEKADPDVDPSYVSTMKAELEKLPVKELEKINRKIIYARDTQFKVRLAFQGDDGFIATQHTLNNYRSARLSN